MMTSARMYFYFAQKNVEIASDYFPLPYSRQKHFHHSTSLLFNRGSTKRVVVLHEFKGFDEETAKVLCLLIVFISVY